MSSSQYRKYSKEVPSYLINRPKSLVVHCLEKISAAKAVDSSGIVMRDHGSFSIVSSTDTKMTYNLSFGDDDKMPHCDCFSWKKSSFPCKHFFAVFQKFPQWNWSCLSKLYIDSPYLTLDDKIVFHPTDIVDESVDVQPVGGLSDVEMGDDDTDEEVNPENDPLTTEVDIGNIVEGDPADMHKNNNELALNVERSKVKDVLVDIKKMIYLVNEREEIDETLSQLKSIQARLKVKVSAEAGLLLENPTEKRKEKENKKRKIEYLSLPKRKKKKVSNRVGEVAHRLKIARTLQIGTKNIKEVKKENYVTESIISNEGFGEEEFVVTHDGLLEDIIILDDGDDVDFEDKDVKDEQKTRQDLNAGDLSAIANHRMLSDNVINTMQNMMKKLYNVNGLQDPVLGQKLNFKSLDRPFIQILHDGNLHWVAISTYGTKEGTVDYMDSLFRGNIALHTKRQICTIMKCKEKSLKINVVPVQQQSNGVDCGVYATAFAMCIAAKIDPKTKSFDQVTMRNNILKSLKDNKLHHFKDGSPSVKRCKERMIFVDLVCTCRMFWTASDKWIYGK